MSNDQYIKNYDKVISPAAQRALKEAEERRKLQHKQEAKLAKEKGFGNNPERTIVRAEIRKKIEELYIVINIHFLSRFFHNGSYRMNVVM